MKLFKKNNAVSEQKEEVSKDINASKAKSQKIDKKKVNNRSLSSWVYQIVFLSVVCFGLCYFLMELLYLKPLDYKYQKQVTETQSESIRQNVNRYFDEQESWVKALASQNHLMVGQEASPIFKEVKSELEELHIISLDNLNQIGSQGGLSFASIDLLRRVAKGERVSIEAFLKEKQWFFQIAALTNIKDRDKQVSTNQESLILAVFNIEGLKQLLKYSHQAYEGEIAIIISGVAQPVLTIGDGLGHESLSLSTQLPDWSIRYAPSKNAFNPSERIMIWTVLGAVIVLFNLILLVIFRININALKGDLLRVVQMTGKAFDSNNKFVNNYHFGEVFTMANAIVARARESIAKYKKQSASTKNEKSVQNDIVEDEPLFDDDLFDLDAAEQTEENHQGSVNEMGNLGDTDALVKEVKRVNVDIPPTIFREYDIRGVVGESLSSVLVELLGKSIGSEALSQGQSTLCVGYDGRLSSKEYADALIQGIISTGMNAVLIGRVPTPILYFATEHFKTGSGVMVTGSHNPSNYNGFKMMIAGNTLSGEAIQKLYNRMLVQDFSEGQGERSEQNVDRIYLDTILNDIAVAAPLKVVLDAGNGVAGGIAPELIEELGCEVIPIHCEVDGTFPNHHPDPGKPENLQDLIAAVKEHQADIGLAFDGDGDRIGVVTNTGKIIWPDRLLMLFAKDVVSRNPGADIIYDVKCSRRLNGLISSYGGRPVMWKTGHSLIKSKMKETGALLAGEMSGHVFFKERWFGFDDGLYSAARLLEILGVEDKTSDEVFAEFPEDLSTPEINIDVDESVKFSIVEKLCARKEQFSGGNVSTIDGLRVDFPNGWGVCRASNTTPTLVLRFEADDEASLSEIKAKFVLQLKDIEPSLNCDF